MNLKFNVLATIFLAALPLGVEAQNLDSYEEYKRVACESRAECNDYNVNFEGAEENNDFAQTTRTRRTPRTRSRSFRGNKFYVGGNIGFYVPGDNLDVGLGLGTLLGYNFSDQIAAELEVYDYFGGSNVEDLGYNFLGIVGNGVYKYPFRKNLYAFFGLGLGIGNLSATGDAADAAEGNGADTSNTDLYFQWKAGVGYSLSNKIDLTGQFRGVKFDAENDVIGNDGTYALEAGLKYNF